jgi:hypothetical protein
MYGVNDALRFTYTLSMDTMKQLAEARLKHLEERK